MSETETSHQQRIDLLHNQYIKMLSERIKLASPEISVQESIANATDKLKQFSADDPIGYKKQIYYLQARFELLVLLPPEIVTTIESQLDTQISAVQAETENKPTNNHEVVGKAIGILSVQPQYKDSPPELFGKMYSLGLSRIDLKNHKSENTVTIEI